MASELIKQLPTDIREKIVKQFTELRDKADADSLKAGFAYSLDLEEVKRSEALIAYGEFRAYGKILEFFKL